MIRRIAVSAVSVAGAVCLALAAANAALAQTAIGRPSVPTIAPGRPGPAAVAPAVQGTPDPDAAKKPVRPISQKVIEQAKLQSEGIYADMDRTGVGGQIQEAWSFSPPRDGVYATRLCDDCVYKVRTREFMTTTIVLPENAVIATADLGDPAGFRVQVKSSNMVAVRPNTYGVDTNLNVYTKSGAVYPFYLRAESFNSLNIPDVVVKLLGQEPGPKSDDGTIAGAVVTPANDTRKPGAPGSYPSAKAGDKASVAVENLTNPKSDSGDFVRSAPFDPSKLHGWSDYKLWGDDELKPVTVFRDQFFTYIQYGQKWDGMELATAYVVNDDIDELVNTRVQGSTFIIESVAPLISLKDGKKFLCLQYTAETP